MLKKIAIFASGSGSNAENIVLHFNQNPNIKVSLILTNNSKAGVLDRAKRLNVPATVFTAKEFKETNVILSLLKECDIDFVVLAGFLLKVPDSLIKAYPNRIVNIHPALLPKYGGKGMYGSRVHETVVAAGENESGITIHYINEHYDEGNIIFQSKCEISPSDAPDDVAHKVHELEYKYYPSVIEDLINHI